MCLIIANPNCQPVPVEHITNAYSTNHDGFGIMYAEPVNNKLKVLRGMWKVDTIKVLFDRVQSLNVPYVAHFRFATHGTKNADNCHPFRVTDYFGGIGMVHNGTLSGQEWRTATKSDTALLVDRLKNHIDSQEMAPAELFEKQAPAVLGRYGSSIGGDKLVFLSGYGDINIVNEGNGTWRDGIWYSNTYSISSGGYYGFGSYDGDDEDGVWTNWRSSLPSHQSISKN